MSHHFSTPAEILPRLLPAGGARASHPYLFLASTPLPHLQRLLLLIIANTVLARRQLRPSQARLGGLLGRRRETVCRALRALQAQGLIKIVRRGKRLNNAYLLAKRIWRAITGQDPPRYQDRQLHLRLRESLARGVSPPRAVLDALKLPEDG